MKNNNCDGGKCREAGGEVRVLPTGGDSNAILCHTCFLNELAFRSERNMELSEFCKFKLPEWASLKVYAAAQVATPYQPKTGARCACRPGQQRDNCPACEGTGWRIDFKAIRQRVS